MTPEQCAAIMRNLPVVQAVAEGREVWFAAFNWKGKFIEWRSSNRVSLQQLCADLYSVKPRYQCLTPNAKPTPVPYPHQMRRAKQFADRRL